MGEYGYFNINDNKEKNKYTSIPNALFDGSLFPNLSNAAIRLQLLFLRRSNLSEINEEFIDDNGNIYIIFKVEEIMSVLRCSKPTAINTLKELEDNGLIDRIKRGMNKPDIIYVCDIDKPINGVNTGGQKNEPPEVKIFNPRRLKIFTHSNKDLSNKDLKKRGGAAASPLSEKKEKKEFPKNSTRATGLESSGNSPENKNTLEYFVINKLNTVEPGCQANFKIILKSSENPDYKQYLLVFGDYENVRLTTWEYDHLNAKYGIEAVKYFINHFGKHIHDHKNWNKNHFRELNDWLEKHILDNAAAAKNGGNKPNNNKFINYEQRKWDYDKIEELALLEQIERTDKT